MHETSSLPIIRPNVNSIASVLVSDEKVRKEVDTIGTSNLSLSNDTASNISFGKGSSAQTEYWNVTDYSAKPKPAFAETNSLITKRSSDGIDIQAIGPCKWEMNSIIPDTELQSAGDLDDTGCVGTCEPIYYHVQDCFHGTIFHKVTTGYICV